MLPLQGPWRQRPDLADLAQSFSFNETQYLSKHEGEADRTGPRGTGSSTARRRAEPSVQLLALWHDAEIPSRIMGPSFTKAPYGHSFIEIDNYHVGFDDVPDVDALFKVPANCAGPLDPLELARAAKTGDTSGLLASESDAALSEADQHHLKSLVDRVAQAGVLSPVVLLCERLHHQHHELQGAAKVEAELQDIVSRGKEARLARLMQRHGGMAGSMIQGKKGADGYPMWPLQFHANHTGNGITFDSVVSPQTQKGVFYYDSTLNRSSTMYYDAETGARSQQIFMDGWVYRVNETSGVSAGRIRIFDMAGPVVPDFIKYFVRQKDQYNLRNHSAAEVVPGSGKTVSGLGLGQSCIAHKPLDLLGVCR